MSEEQVTILTDDGVGVVGVETGEPNLEALGLAKLRRLSKSVAISLDVEAKKLASGRLTRGSHKWNEIAEEHALLDELEVDIKSAMHNLIHGS